MNSTEYVSTLLESLIQKGTPKPDIVRSISTACVGWPYVFGAWGEICTPAGRKRRYRDDHPTIKTACQVLNGKAGSCAGCKWNLPVRMYDCRGFTDWCLKQVGIDLQGEGATSQWNNNKNWVLKGKISEMPRDRVCCVFVQKGEKMEHTGLYLGDGSTCECSAGVQYFEKMKSKWTHYAVPAGLYDDTPTPTPAPTPSPDKKPTLRRGDTGDYVKLAQEELIQRGYDLGSYGADGKFGAKTEAAVKQFQQDWGLTVDGIIGQKTWAMLDSTPVAVKYYVIIPHLSLKDAEALAALYQGTQIIKEDDA
jgi:cell wall-associated NlpC family hydrolase